MDRRPAWLLNEYAIAALGPAIAAAHVREYRALKSHRFYGLINRCIYCGAGPRDPSVARMCPKR